MNPLLQNFQLKLLRAQTPSGARDFSLLEPSFQVFWRWLSDFIPLWVSPNLISLFGGLSILIPSLISVYVSPNATLFVSPWLAFFCAVGYFLFQTFDALDGKQARKLNTGSSFGEMFDSACDVIAIASAVTAFCVVLRLGDNPWLMLAVCLGEMTAVYFYFWQEYVSGTYKFFKIDCTEEQVLFIATFLSVGWFGSDILTKQIPYVGLELRYIPVILALFIFMQATVNNLILICRGGSGKNGSSSADTNIWSPSRPLLLFFAIVALCLYNSTDGYLQHKCLYNVYFLTFIVKFTHKLILATAIRSPIYTNDFTVVAYALIALNWIFNVSYFEDVQIIRCITLLNIVDIIVHSWRICNEYCNFMGIKLLSNQQPAVPVTQRYSSKALSD